jgi:hypothetical protein
MAAIFYALAKKRPQDYEQLTKELVRVGEYSVGGYVVRPSAGVAEKMYAVNPADANYVAMEMFEADWVVLATARSGESDLGYDGLERLGHPVDMFKAINWPGLMTRLAKAFFGQAVHDKGLFVPGLLLNKSPLGWIHDVFSDADIRELIDLDAKFRSGSQILLMVDSDILYRQQDAPNRKVVSYNPASLGDSHWIVYEGGLSLLDKNGAATTDVSAVCTIRFKAYTWGAEPGTGLGFSYPGEQPLKVSAVSSLSKNGILASSWEANYYGYIEIR